MLNFKCNNCIYYSHCTTKDIAPHILDAFNTGIEDLRLEVNMDCKNYTPGVPEGYPYSKVEFESLIENKLKKVEIFK